MEKVSKTPNFAENEFFRDELKLGYQKPMDFELAFEEHLRKGGRLSMLGYPRVAWVPETFCRDHRMPCPFGDCTCTPKVNQYMTKKVQDVLGIIIVSHVEMQCKESKRTFNTLADIALKKLPFALAFRLNSLVTHKGTTVTMKLFRLVDTMITSTRGIKRIFKNLTNERANSFLGLILKEKMRHPSSPIACTVDEFLRLHRPADPRALQDLWINATDLASPLASVLMQEATVKKCIMIDSSRKFCKKLFCWDKDKKKKISLKGTHLLLLACNEIHQIVGRRFIAAESHAEQGPFLKCIAKKIQRDREGAAASLAESGGLIDFCSIQLEDTAESPSLDADPMEQESQDHSDSELAEEFEANSDLSESSDDEDVEDPRSEELESKENKCHEDPRSEQLESKGFDAPTAGFDERKTIYVVTDHVNVVMKVVREMDTTLVRYLPRQDVFHLTQRATNKINQAFPNAKTSLQKSLHDSIFIENSGGEIKKREELLSAVMKTLNSVPLHHVKSEHKQKWQGTLKNTEKQISRGDLDVPSNKHVENGLTTKILTTSPLEGINSELSVLLVRSVHYRVGMRMLDKFICRVNMRQGIKYGRIPATTDVDLVTLLKLSIFAPESVSVTQVEWAKKILHLSQNMQEFAWRTDAGEITDVSSLLEIKALRMDFFHDPLDMQRRSEKEFSFYANWITTFETKHKHQDLSQFIEALKTTAEKKEFTPIEADVLKKLTLEMTQHGRVAFCQWSKDPLVLTVLYNWFTLHVENEQIKPKPFESVLRLLQVSGFPENPTAGQGSSSSVEKKLITFKRTETKHDDLSPEEVYFTEVAHSFVGRFSRSQIRSTKEAFQNLWLFAARLFSGVYDRNEKQMRRRFDALTKSQNRKRKKSLEDAEFGAASERQSSLLDVDQDSREDPPAALEKTMTESREASASDLQPSVLEEKVECGEASAAACVADALCMNPPQPAPIPAFAKKKDMWSDENVAKLRTFTNAVPNEKGKWKRVVEYAASEIHPSFSSFNERTFRRHLASPSSDKTPSDELPIPKAPRLFIAQVQDHKVVTSPSEQGTHAPSQSAQASRTPQSSIDTLNTSACDSCRSSHVKCDGSRKGCIKRSSNVTPKSTLISYFKKV